MPERWMAIEDAQQAAWRGFAERLPKKARLLDLATGDARVPRWILAMRPDIVANAVDLAPQLPPAPPGVTVQAGVAMEDLPFDDASFDAVVSQFGFEYGSVPETAAEIERVLAPGGIVGLMVHRGDGPILEFNVARRTQIEWVLREGNLIEAVKTAVDRGEAGLHDALTLATDMAREGASKWGDGTPAWEIPEAVRRTLILGGRGPRDKLLGTFDLIADQARNDIGRIDSLAAACVTADDRDGLATAFQDVGMSLVDTLTVAEPSGRAFADLLTLSRG